MSDDNDTLREGITWVCDIIKTATLLGFKEDVKKFMIDLETREMNDVFVNELPKIIRNIPDCKELPKFIRIR